MKAKLILICVLSGLCGNAFAQDIIHTIDGRSIEATVLEINDDDILYKTFDNQGGPDYRMSVSRVARIVFQNGTEKSFAPSSILVPMYMIHTDIMVRSSIAGAITMTAGEDSMLSNCRIIWAYPFMGVITGRPAANTRAAFGSPSVAPPCWYLPS